MKTVIETFFLSTVLLLISSTQVYSQKVETIDGVRYIQNSAKGKWGNNPRVSIKHSGTLGQLDGDENYMFYKPADIAADGEGNIYVLDAGNHRVQKFNKDHKYLQTIGREGQGPGELSRPLYLDLDKDGNIYVSDISNARIQVFSPDGNNLKTISVVPKTLIFRLLNNGQILLRNPYVNMPDVELQRGKTAADSDNRLPLFKIMDRNTKIISKFGNGVIFTKFPFTGGGNRFLFSIDDDENIYAIFLFQNRLEKYSPDGKLLFKAERYINPEKSIDKKLKMYTTLARGIDIDSKGRIWVLAVKNKPVLPPRGSTTPPKDYYELEVFSNDGILLYKYPLSVFWDGLRIIDDRLYILDKDHNMQYNVFEIIEK
ncbi:NHL repeat-containing protein [candidate division KSB1 bacterium]